MSCIFPAASHDLQKAFVDQFHRARRRLTLEGFEQEYTKLVETYPKAKKYCDVLYHDRERWAVYGSVLAFSVSSFTTNRVECEYGVQFVCEHSGTP